MAKPTRKKPPTQDHAMHRPVILQIIPELSAGGAEQGCIDVAREIKKSDAESIVISQGGNRLHELKRANVTHIDLPVKSKNPLTILRNAKRIRRIIEEYNVDIVHVRSRAPAWSAFLACQKTDAFFITTVHAPYNITGKAKRWYNAIMTRGERVIAISHYVAEYLKKNYKINPGRIRVIHRGIALEKFHPTAVTTERLINLSKQWRIPDGASVVMLPGRLTRWKGHMVLLEAMGRLRRKDVCCVFLGDDQGRKEYRQELETMIQEKGLGGKIRIVEHCKDMPAAYMLATVVVSASTDPEGFGRVPVEAQAMGRPIIATEHGGAVETVINGETGWLIPPGDAAALASALEEALSLDPTRRAILATRAMSNVAENFTREKMCDETLNVYAELLQEKYGGTATHASHPDGHKALSDISNQMAAE